MTDDVEGGGAARAAPPRRVPSRRTPPRAPPPKHKGAQPGGRTGAFRADGSGEMASARRMLKALGYNVLIGESNAPWIGGRIERYFRTLKQRDLHDITGNADLYLAFEGDREDPRTARSRNNADDTRLVPVKHEVPIECLPTIEEFRALVLWAVKAHMNTRSRALGRRSPLTVWRMTAPEPQATVAALIAKFPTHEVQVTGSGVEVRDRLYNCPALQDAFEPRQKAFVRADPLQRGVYVYPLQAAARARSEGLFVPDAEVWVRSLSPQEFTKQNRAAYGQIRDRVNESRARVLGETIGEEALADVTKQIEGRADAQDKASRRGNRVRNRRAEKHKAAEGAQQVELPLAAPPPRMARAGRVAPGTREARPASGDAPGPPHPRAAAPTPKASPAAAGAAPPPAPPVSEPAAPAVPTEPGGATAPPDAHGGDERARVLPLRAGPRRPLFAPRFVADAAPVAALAAGPSGR